ncbi:MAG: bacteriohemerythrin [Bacteroidales bacterium]
MVKKLAWKNSFSIGNAMIDKQHFELFEIFNALVDLVDNNKSQEKFAEILSRLTDYSLKHFRGEEEYMAEFDYPYLESHQRIHRQFVFKVATFNADYLSDDPPSPKEVLSYIGNWWWEHVQHVDMDYENFKNLINSRTSF